MASLRDILQRTMLFTAAHDAGIDAYSTKLGPSAPLPCPAPAVNPSLASADQPVWQWKHDPASPAKVFDVTCLMRAMGAMAMPVATQIDVEEVSVVVDPGDEPVKLPLTPAFVIAKFGLDAGTIVARNKGWWQLPANVDRSFLVVFAYELVPASGTAPKQLSLDQIESLDKRFFPDPDVPADDPDAPEETIPDGDPPDATVPPAKAATNQKVTAFIGPTWVIVAFGFTTCKQRADFEPGGVLGAGRVYPHVMVTCNRALANVTSKINMRRPTKAMKMDPEMMDDIGTIFVADTNDLHGTPLPLWSNFFDYWELNPDTAFGLGTELKFVDSSKTTERQVPNAIIRERTAHVGAMYQSSSPFRKVPFQGEFDNIHMAPRMRFTSKTGLVISDIAMAPFCEHDCFHTHTRWGTLGMSQPKANRGFSGRKPYASEAAPLVPANQSVFISLTSKSAIKYRGVADGPLPAGTWTVINHHGSAYALEIEGTKTVGLSRFGVQQYNLTFTEPFVRVTGGFFGPVRVTMDVDPTLSFAAFYQRLQFTGTANPDVWMPRVKILDMDACRKT